MKFFCASALGKSNFYNLRCLNNLTTGNEMRISLAETTQSEGFISRPGSRRRRVPSFLVFRKQTGSKF